MALHRLLKRVDQGLAVPMVILGGLVGIPTFFMKRGERRYRFAVRARWRLLCTGPAAARADTG